MLTPHGQLPDFLIVGAAKSGTTSLYAYLREHPRIFMPAIKEPHFFSYAGTEWDSRVFAHTLPEYTSIFAAAAPNQRIGEAYGDAAQNLRIVIMLRDPAERVFSLYSMYALCGFENLAAEQAIVPESYCRLAARVPGTTYGIPLDYLRSGLSYDAIRSYLAVFPHTMVIRYPDFSEDARAITNSVLAFLGLPGPCATPCIIRWNRTGVPYIRPLNRLLNRVRQFVSMRRPIPFSSFIIRCINTMQSRTMRPASMPPKLRKRLSDLFHDDMVATERLLHTHDTQHPL